MGDTFVWTGDANGKYLLTPGNWYDATTGTAATRAPGANDTVDFTANAPGVFGDVAYADVNIASGAQVSVGPLPGGATYSFGTLTLGSSASLTLGGGTSMTVGNADLGAGATLDISQAWWLGVSTDDPNAEADAADTTVTGGYPGPLSAITDSLTLAPGASVDLGDNNLGVGMLDNGNSGSGNDFAPDAGISGTGKLVDPSRNEVAFAPTIPAIDFGAVQQGQVVTETFTITNDEGDAATFPLVGAIQTDANGASVTDSDLSGSGVTAQDFSLPGRGGSATFTVTLDAQTLGSLQDQAINIAYAFDGPNFDVNELVPITGTVVGDPDSIGCFVAGTRIATEDGERPAEMLRPGDRVRTASGRIATVAWVGLQPLDVAAPIRIAAGAIAPGVPCRDLLLSPDHAVFLEGALIPAYLLRNGATIRAEPARRGVTYVHVELDRHDVLLAEGLPCESYLDTGNRAAFGHGFGAVAGRADVPEDRLAAALAAYAASGCAPLLRDGAAVAAAHRMLMDRALALGWRFARHGALAVLAPGCVLPGRKAEDGTLLFTVPAGATELRLTSRSFVPSEMDPDRPDGRRLGIAVALTLDGAPLPEPAFGPGWYPPEDGAAWRWTNGAAHLLLPPHRRGSQLRVQVMPTGARYWLPPRPNRAAA